jgi:arylsulfatase A-like enzyme
MRNALMLVLLCFACGGPAPLTVDMPLHLEDHVEAATITGSELPANPPQPVEWHFDQPQPDWKPTPLWNPPFGAPTLARTGDGLRVTLTDRTRVPDGQLRGVIHVDLPDWDRGDWADVVIRARADSASSVNIVGFGFNLREGRGPATNPAPPFQFFGQNSPIVRDGTIQTYRLRVGAGAPDFRDPWRQLALVFGTNGDPGSIELLSVSVVPSGTVYAEAPHGVRPVTMGERIRRALYTHALARVSYRVRVPEGGRLDAGLGVLGAEDSVTFRVRVRAGGDEETLLQERYADPTQWAQRSVDLARFAGQTVTLSLESDAAQAGTVAFWAAPTVSGARRADRPNVILYVIDGGGADYMSVYGYNRRTTPNLERLAAEGAVFEHAYSTSSWTKPSTASFMTSLHASVLGLLEDRDPVPEQAPTMAERFHRAGYQTAVFTANPNASTVSGLERSVDLVPNFRVQNDAESSVKLHQAFWTWRTESPGQPYWAHFQSTDVHAVSRNTLELFGGIPLPQFAGLYVSPRDVDTLRAWSERVQAGGGRIGSTAFTTGGLQRAPFFTLLQGMYDQQMAHNDFQLGRLVDRLKASGEWQNTLLVVTADHSIAGSFTDTRAGMLDSLPPPWSRLLLRPTVSRVPLLVVWPGHISGGQRFDDPVSLIDVLPTVLDLVGLPRPDVMQGQSLAPLLLGRPGWTPHPVILDEFNIDRETGRVQGRLEIVDGQWGASLWIGPPPADTLSRRPWPLLLYDLWNDPFALQPINEERSDLVERYTAFLEQQWKDHQALATRFKAGEQVVLTPDQLERLRALGYIR